MLKKLLLLSNSTNFGEAYLEYPKSSIQSFLGDQIRKVLFVPYAGVGVSYDEYTRKVALPFTDVDYNLEGIHTFSNPVTAVESAEAIAIGGGNTFELLNQLYRNNLLEPIRKRVEEGVPFMGWSAGSNVAGPSIKTTNDMPIIEPPSFDALNLVPFQINPHYTEERLPNHGGETRKDRLYEFIALNPDVNVVGIPEGNLLQIEGNKVKLVGEGSISIFRQGEEAKIYNSNDDLGFLMS